MNVLDLFSGIGGFSLGLERAGMRTVAFCEIEPYCRAVLRKHWPNVPVYEDVRNLTADVLRADGIVPDVICGGFPCQDISIAGKRIGLEGARSSLWFEYARLIREVSPRWVIIENVSALRNRGLETVLGQIDALGFNAEWHCIPASAVGAPHRRDRIWIVAHSDRQRPTHAGEGDAGRERLPGRNAADSGRDEVDDAMRGRHWPPEGQILSGWDSTLHSSWWSSEPSLGRVADGVPHRVDRLRSLGNAVVPQIPQIIGEAIMRFERELKPSEAEGEAALTP